MKIVYLVTIIITLFIIFGNHDGVIQANQETVIVHELFQPIQLVYPDVLHRDLVINETSLAMLNQLGSDQSILGVVGTFHSGKSFLLNQLLNTTDRFVVGPTVHPQTMGIWIWAAKITYNNQPHNLLLLDTEGFYSSNVSETYDAKIFAITTLLSSHLIYNSVKIIDQSALEYLELLSRRTQLFALKSQIKSDSPLVDILEFPQLTWVVQDFFQDIGLQSATEWLHDLLKAHSRDQPDSNLSISKIFPSIDCHTLFIPSGDRSTLRHLDKAKLSDLNPIYRKEVDILRKSLFTTLKPRLKGPAIGSLFRLLVDVANSQSFPSVPSIWIGFIKQQQQLALDDTILTYKDKMNRVHAEDLPLTEKDYQALEESTYVYSQNLYKQLLFGLPEAYSPGLIKLLSMLKELETTYHKECLERIKTFCKHIGTEQFDQFQHNINQIKTPSSSKNLLSIIEQYQSQSLNTYVSRTIAYSQSKSQSQYMTILKNDIERASSLKQLQNKNEIELLLTNSVSISSDKFKMLMKGFNKYPTSFEELDKYQIQQRQLAVSHFNEITEIVKEEIYYEAFISNLEKSLNILYDQFKEHNEKKIKEYIKEISSQSIFEFKKSANTIILPVEDEFLDGKLNEFKETTIRNFEKKLTTFTRSKSYTEEIEYLNNMLNKQIEFKNNENVEQMKIIVLDNLNTVKLVMKTRLSSYWFQYSFMRDARDELDKKIKLKIESARLRSKIIDNFIEKDLKSEVESLFHLSTLLFTVVIGFLLLFILVKMK